MTHPQDVPAPSPTVSDARGEPICTLTGHTCGTDTVRKGDTCPDRANNFRCKYTSSDRILIVTGPQPAASTPPTVSDAMREAVAMILLHQLDVACHLAPGRCKGELEGLPEAVEALCAPAGPIASALAALERDNATLRERLEISHAYNLDGDKVPFPEGMPDGIECRDETIRNLEDINATLRAENTVLSSANAEIGGEEWTDIRQLEAEAKLSTLRDSAERMKAAHAEEVARLRAIETPRPISEWHEDMGFALWWILPVCEPPYSGSPLCDDWPEYHTHFTPLPEIRDEDYRPKRTAQTFRDAPIDEHGYVDMSARAALTPKETPDA